MAKPIKFIKVQINNVSVAATTTVNGDPAVPYRWNATLAVVSQPHSDSTTTPVGNFFTGRNIAVGDWIVSSSEGKALRVASISVATDSSVTCVLEDVGSANALNDENGNLDGMIPNGAGIVSFVFEVVGNVPVLSGMPSSLPGNLSYSFAQNVVSRFAANYGGASVITSDLVTIGVLGDTNKRIAANVLGTNKPELRFNATSDAWEYSNNGTTFKSFDLAVATATVLGGVKQGTGINIDANGVISSTNSYSHPTNDGAHHVPATGTTNNGKVLKAGATAGSEAWGAVDFSELTGKPTTIAGYGIINAVVANQAIVAGSGAKITYDAKGLVTSSAALTPADIPSLDWTKIGSGKPTTLSGYGITDAVAKNAAITAGTFPKITFDADGLVTGGAALVAGDIPALPWSQISSGKPTTLSGYGITDATPSSHVGAGAAAHAVATTAANGFMSAADKVKLDGMNVPSFAFTVNFAGSSPGSVTGLPVGWSAAIAGNQVTITHTVGSPLKSIFYWGVSAAGGVQRYRLPSASNEVTIPVATVNSQFTATISTSITGSDVDGTARIVVTF